MEQMQRYTIKDIELLCGIKGHTIRYWQKQYLTSSKENIDTKHTYAIEDVIRFICISFLYQSGKKIKNLIDMGKEQLINEVEQNIVAPNDFLFHSLKLLLCILTFDYLKMEKQFRNIIDAVGFEKCISQVCHPLLQRLQGLSFDVQKEMPYENFFYYFLQNNILAEMNKLPLVTETQNAVLLFAPQEDGNELHLHFLRYLFRKSGWPVLFLGSGISISMLDAFYTDKNIAYLYVQLPSRLITFFPDDYFETLCLTFKTKKIIASGAGLTKLQRNFVNLTLLKTDEEIEQFIKSRH
jgi:DNA-binding transcriptional MerR regulator